MIVAIIGIVSIFFGVKFISEGIINQAQTRVRGDLNSAREIYKVNEERILNVAKYTANRFFIKNGILEKDWERIVTELRRVKQIEGVDFIALTDEYGKVILRTTDSGNHGDDVSKNNVIKYCLTNRASIVATELLTDHELRKEDSSLIALATTKIIPTPRAKFKKEGFETSGMVIFAAAPVLDEKDRLLGALYCGKIINKDHEIVDKIKNTVFFTEKYKDKEIGTATIFMSDLRISTNVMNKDGARAIGTLISNEVYGVVIEQGLTWIARAFVVDDWYITAYKPIKNSTNEVIGILAVGILEKKYTDMRNQIILIFVSITFLSMLAVFAFSYIITTNITKPLGEISLAARKIARGDFPSEIKIKTKDEIADLGEAFQFMISSLKARDKELKESVRKTVAEAERLAMIGQLAAGVAHEVNNPLTGILLYCDLVLKDMPKYSPQRESLKKIEKEAKRCKNIIRGLLDFARPKKPEIKESSINNIIESTLSLIKNQTMFVDIKIEEDLDSNLPLVKIDPDQIQQVFMNIIINAAEAMNGKGQLFIKSQLSESNESVLISFTDTGFGITEENLKKIFEPFFTTKEVTHGVGLGLAISQRIIKDHKGRIGVTSELGRRTTFTVKLPLSA